MGSKYNIDRIVKKFMEEKYKRIRKAIEKVKKDFYRLNKNGFDNKGDK